MVNATQLYELSEEHGFTGAETTVVSFGDGELVVGAATGYGNGIQFPYLGVQARLPSTFFDTSNNTIKFGVWIGRDYDSDDTKGGIKASMALW